MMAGIIRVCVVCGRTFISPRGRATCTPICAFWSMVDRTGGPDACWPWLSNVSARTGYGNVSGRYNGGERINAHRMAWKLTNCCDPGCLCVLHRCDNKLCANPRHLFLGTHRTNLFDSYRKGKTSACTPGEGHPRARLTDAIVLEIRASGENAQILANLYGVRPQTIQQARQGKTWRHLNEDDAPPTGSEGSEVLEFSRPITSKSTVSQGF